MSKSEPVRYRRGVFSLTMRNGTLRSGSLRNVVETCSTVPAFQSGFTTWNISMASGELAFEPKPLSVRVRNVPSFRFLMPDRPCTGWPLNGRLMPVGRGAALSERAEMPGTLSGVSILWVGGPAKRPEICSSGGASAGAGTSVMAGRMAWPSSTDGYLVCAAAAIARPRAAVAVMVKSSWARIADLPCSQGSYLSDATVC